MMTPEEILAVPPRALSQAQREFYFDNGYLVVEKAIEISWLEELRRVTEEMVNQSRDREVSDEIWDLEAGHSPNNPRLRRLSSPCDQHAFYWRYLCNSIVADIAADLLGGDIRYHHTKLNFKASGGGADVKWHQDIQFWPHTNYSPLTIGTYLYDCGPDQGPLAVIPGSHEGPLFDLYDDKGNWTGHIGSEDLPRVNTHAAEYLCAPAGSLTIHNCRTVHGSPANVSGASRPLFLAAMAAADAFPYTPNPIKSRYDGQLIRGRLARYARHDPRPCPIPPDWSGGYQSIFAHQQGEVRDYANTM